MPHPEVANRTPYAFALSFLADEDGRALLVPMLQGTFALGADRLLRPLEEQPEVNLEGACWGPPDTSSIKLEPQVAFIKPGTDVVLIGHAYAPESGTVQMKVGLRAGPLSKLVHVFGDRRLLSGTRITPPEAFDRIPLRYEYAFGGWDRRHSDPEQHSCEPRNPVGRGYRSATLPVDEEVLLPNIEDPAAPFRAYGERPPPAGFGFIAPHWQPRASLAGTYDEAWMKSRMPLLPADFDRRFFNAASPGLIAQGYLRGDEPVTVVGTTAEGRLDFNLPGVGTPLCHLELRGLRHGTLGMPLDTVIIDTDARTVTMVWRACLALRNGPHDVRAAVFHFAGQPVHLPPEDDEEEEPDPSEPDETAIPELEDDEQTDELDETAQLHTTAVKGGGEAR